MKNYFIESEHSQGRKENVSRARKMAQNYLQMPERGLEHGSTALSSLGCILHLPNQITPKGNKEREEGYILSQRWTRRSSLWNLITDSCL
ncbi:hypothetical protein E1B28_012016 [Marasmius oreades]|uniref:Uncharacterized protein n=1 Tax=Marasmius oreades TaxID=181124 RepID=A0A9P7UPH3_9AGAR|nr:uncharacterized protein E1B28_012016 [Marasmius oreades]KAG7087976.1 hypothetical protein E1B28_012016 [Marasmius oreades]